MHRPLVRPQGTTAGGGGSTSDHPAIAENAANLFQFDEASGDELRQGLPPIIGSEGGSAWVGGKGHVRGGPLPRSAELGEGLYLGVDLQPDSRSEQIVLGSGKAGASALRLVVNHEGVAGHISVLLRDEDGRTLEVNANGSDSIARRLVVSAKPRENGVSIYEIQPWALNPLVPLPCSATLTESPNRFVFDQPFAVGGWFIDGQHRGPYAGRLANVFINDKYLDQTRVTALANASDNPTALTHEGLGEPSAEMLSRFLRDAARLRSWLGKPTMSRDDMDDASALLHRWLFDRTAVLAEVCRNYGVQLWLPGESERGRAYVAVVLQDGPLIHMPGARGPDAPMGFEWATLDRWRTEAAFHVQGLPVSREAFIKFVRNKLGSGHFDEAERKKWQRDLLAVTEGLRVLDQEALVFQMGALVSEVSLALSATRAEVLANATSGLIE
jgi:hypothetical protein